MALEITASSRNVALKLALGCDLLEVRPAAGLMRSFLLEQGVSEQEIQACELALAEACNNAIKYVPSGKRSESIQVDVLCGSEQLELRVNDHTQGFEWPEKVDLPDFEKETGRGLYLIHSVMDHVKYLRGRGQNCLIMQRRRAGQNIPPTSREELERRANDSENIVRDMAEELSFCYESLSAIFRCSAELGKNNDLEEFARRLLSDLSQITSADWFVFRMAVKNGARLDVFVASDATVLLSPLVLQMGPASRSVEVEAALSREDVWFDQLSPLHNADPLAAVRTDSFGLVHPIYLAETLVGTLTIAKRSGQGVFTAVQANVVHTFADFLAIQIVNARYTEDQVRNRLVSRELEIAKTIQRSLLPKTIPHLPGYGLAGFCESAHQVGGDFYDVLKISEDAVLLIIADVMGKGIPAAMFAAILRSLLRAVPEWMSQPAALLGRVNRLLFEELSGVDMFITAQLVYVDSKSRRMTAASAGHCPVLLGLEGDANVRTFAPEGLPLGILPDTTFSNHVEPLPKNCRLLLYTDGLTEARNMQGEFFGQERLIKWLGRSAESKKSADELKQELAEELIQFQGSATLSDDQTFLFLAE
jgi:serine phosphatase RsbU (regulator of sigma subunit)/anti-sigma regulatory factor (Ser/Thr protein kinase)